MARINLTAWILRQWRTRPFVIAAAAAVAATAAVYTGMTLTGNGLMSAQTFSFFTSTDTSIASPDPDNQSVEVGLRFTSSSAGTVNAVRFLKVPGDTSTHTVSVWSSSGTRLATATATGETASGWQQVGLTTPIAVAVNQTYTVSFHTTRYYSTARYFTAAISVGPLTAGTTNGVYLYGSGGYPTQTYQSSNYWVDLVFQTGTQPSLSPSTSPSGGLGLPTLPWEGGPAYYSRWTSTSPWTNPNFFPIGVWKESVLQSSDTSTDKAAGLNTYVTVTDNTQASLIRAAGMYLINDQILAGSGSEMVTQELPDEVDMTYGPGWDSWSGNYGWNTCVPAQNVGGQCGYTVLQTLNAQRAGNGFPQYTNFGKGVQMWETDQQAQVFVNQFQQIVSSDMYFYTDPNLCPTEAQRYLGIAPSLCRRAANYGRLIDRLRLLDGMDNQRVPLFGFVEDGHPFTENSAPTITANQIAGAVMSSLIHGARGIIYFNHNFGGSCISQHVLRDSCGAAVRPTVTETNQRITTLAPVLNTPSYQWTANASVDTMLKAYGGSYYLFAMPGASGGTGTQTLTLPSTLRASTAQVMFENRNLSIANGQFTDSFAAEYSYHIYKITP